MMNLMVLLLCASLSQYSATIYDADEDYQEDYEDAEEIIAYNELDETELESFEKIDNPKKGKKYSLGKAMEPGDIVEVHASYGNNKNSFSVTLMGDTDDNFFKSRFRPGKKTILTGKVEGEWQQGVYAQWPRLNSGQDFVIKVVMYDESYEVFVDDIALNHNYKFSTRNEVRCVNSVLLAGGNGGLTWTRIILPGENKSDKYRMIKDLEENLSDLKERITDNVNGQSTNAVKQYANSAEGTIDLFQWRLLQTISDKSEMIDLDDSTLQWILSNQEILEMLMTSGDIANDNYKKALIILVKLINEDPLIKTVPLRMRLAVATAVTFAANCVRRMAVAHSCQDGMSKYKSFMDWSEKGLLYEQFNSGTAWHLRYVVGSWATSEELEWVRAKTPDSCDNPADIGKGYKGMVGRGANAEGLWLGHSPNRFYYFQPQTLKTLHEIGGACGAISKFSTGMIQSHGVPAMPVGMIKHCAFAWWKPDGEWSLDYASSGWEVSKTHRGIQYSWERPAYYFLLMNSAQKHLAEYRLSEKMRIAAKMALSGDRFEILEEASTVSPYNFDVWVELRAAMEDPTLEKATIHSTLLPILPSAREWQKDPENDHDISLEATVTSEDFVNATGMVSGIKGYRATCASTIGELLLDFPDPAEVNSIYIQWWKWSKAKHYDVYAMGSDGEYVLVKTQADERVEGRKSPRSFLDGWGMKTNRIKIEMRNERPSNNEGPVNHIEISKLIIKGRLYDYGAVSDGRPVTSSELSTGTENLVDNDENTLWTANAESSWFEIDLGKICVVDDVEFSWMEGTQPDHITISYKVGNGPETEFVVDQPFDKVPLDVTAATVRVNIRGGNPILKGIKMHGTAYSSKQLLKLKMEMAYDQFPPAVNKKVMRRLIDAIEYTD